MFALIRKGAVARTNPHEAQLRGDMLPGDRIAPAVEELIPAGNVADPTLSAAYKVEDNRVVITPGSRPLAPGEAEEAAKARRANLYPPIGDQLDAVMKGLDKIAQGEPLPPETLGWIAELKAIKTDNPKAAA